MKIITTIIFTLFTLISVGQEVNQRPGFVSDYLQNGSPESFKKILSYYDSINDKPTKTSHCWKYCIGIHIDSNTIIIDGDSIADIEELSNLLHRFFINPKKFKFGHGDNEDYGTKGRVEIYFNKKSTEMGHKVVEQTLKAFKLYTDQLQQKGIRTFDYNEIDTYILNHLDIYNNWMVPEPPEFE